jgi:hypothetical protein
MEIGTWDEVNSNELKKEVAEQMLPQLIEQYGLHPDMVSIDRRLTDILNGLYMFYGIEIIGIFESKIRQAGEQYFLDVTFHPVENAHLIVAKIHAKKEELAFRVQMYRQMREDAGDETYEQQKARINRFRCG